MAKIYALNCRDTGMSYIGCTGNLSKRFREHRCLLRQNKHMEPKLQADWNEYGELGFSMIQLQDLPDATVNQKRQAELEWMKVYKGFGGLYNTRFMSFGQTPEVVRKWVEAGVAARRGKPQSPEANLKRRLAQLGKPKGHGAKISATKRLKSLMR